MDAVAIIGGLVSLYLAWRFVVACRDVAAIRVALERHTAMLAAIANRAEKEKAPDCESRGPTTHTD